jgi:hypothetical protein
MGGVAARIGLPATARMADFCRFDFLIHHQAALQLCFSLPI